MRSTEPSERRSGCEGSRRPGDRPSPRPRSIAVALVVALPLLPTTRQAESATDAESFFSSASATRNIPPGSIVLTYPYSDAPKFPGVYGGWSPSPRYQDINAALLGQAVAGMPFKVIGSYGWRPNGGRNGTPGPSPLGPPSVHALFDLAFYGVFTDPGQLADLTAGNVTADIRTFVARHHVGTVVMLPVGQQPDMVQKVLAAALGAPVHVDGATAWYHVEQRLRTAPATAGSMFSAPPPSTQLAFPSAGALMHGTELLGAAASFPFGVGKITFRITGGDRTLTVGGGPFSYGWIAYWDTKEVPNGTYTVASIASGLGGSTTSAAVTVTVDN